MNGEEMRYDVRSSVDAPLRSGSRPVSESKAPHNREGKMKRITTYVLVVLLLIVLAGCGATASLITVKSRSERTDVFTEVTDAGATPQGFADMIVKANIKTHEAGYYIGESRNSLHGKPGYPFVINIDGQAAVWKVDGQKHELPEYVDGKTSRDPEAGEGIKYVLNKKIRLRAGPHKVFFGLHEDDYYREVVVNVKEGEAQTLEFMPVYKYKTYPTWIPTYMKGVSHYVILVNENPVTQ